MRIRLCKQTPWELFWRKVNKDGPIPAHCPELGQCWVWTGSRRTTGHGHFYFDGSIGCAHRFAYLASGGEIPDGLSVLHKCDNGACVRDSHLFLGTQLDNMRDAASKNRTERGSNRYNAVLNEQDARSIYTLYHRDGLTLGELAERFGVPQGRIAKVKNGVAWSHVTSGLGIRRRAGYCGPVAKQP